MSIVIGIETSCDETAVAIVNDKKEILSHIILTQFDKHRLFGGVVPEIAARNHIDCLEEIVKESLKQASLKIAQLDAIAATAGPGLIGGVLVGTMLAKGLAITSGKPFIAINHLEGHALTVRMVSDVKFPYLLLLVSGGHCQILEVNGVGQYRIIGQTVDDAVGEAFDKSAKLLGLEYPGGPEIERMALNGDAEKFQLPKPMLRKSKYDFSFSGLKTAVRNLIDSQKNNGIITDQIKSDICASLQKTIAEILINRLSNAAEFYMKNNNHNKISVIAGGVAANRYLNSNICNALKPIGFEVISPPINLCTDNGAMIAWAGVERLRLGLIDDISFMPRSRWSLEDLK
jgi:N6-L-threonylcarbamoyladenine synthase